MLNFFFPRGFFQRTCSIDAQKKQTIHVPTPFWRPVYIGGFRDAPLKCTIDTKISYIWKGVTFSKPSFLVSIPSISGSLGHPGDFLFVACKCVDAPLWHAMLDGGENHVSSGVRWCYTVLRAKNDNMSGWDRWKVRKMARNINKVGVSSRWLRKGAYQMAEYKWVTGLVGGFNPFKNSSQPGNLPQIEVKMQMFEAIK